MDKRNHERTAKRIKVVCHSKGAGILCGKTRDVSVDGMFVEVPMVRKLDKKNSIRVAFKNGDDLQIVSSRLIQKGNEGFAIQFTKLDTQARSALRSLLQ